MIIATVVATTGIYLWVWITGGPEETNPEIFPIFRAIEASCLQEEWPHETVRCKGALDMTQECDQSEYACTAKEYYCVLYRLGFDLPPYYHPNSDRRDKHPC